MKPDRLRLNDWERYNLDMILQRLRQLHFHEFCAGDRTQVRLVEEIKWLSDFIGERRRIVSRKRVPGPDYDTLQERDMDRPGLIGRLHDD